MTDKQCFSVSEVATRWGCSEADILRFAAERKLTLGCGCPTWTCRSARWTAAATSCSGTVESERLFTGFVPLDAATVAKIARGWTWHLSKVADMGNGPAHGGQGQRVPGPPQPGCVSPRGVLSVSSAPAALPRGAPKKRKPTFNLSSASAELQAAIALS